MSLGIQPDLARQVLESLPVGVYVVDREGKIMLWSAGAEQITGYLRQDVLGRLCGDHFLQHTDGENNPLEGAALPLMATLREGKPVLSLASLRGKSGRSIPVSLQTVPLRDSYNTVQGAVEVFQEVTPRSKQDRRQTKLAAFGCVDTLTGLLNHSLIQAHLKEQFTLFSLYPVPFSVLCISINDLPKLRERYGQAAVDATLRVVAQTIENSLRPTDYLGRWLEHEFLAILTECGEPELYKICPRIQKIVRHAEVVFWGEPLHVSVALGATPAHDNDTVSSLISRAELAMRRSLGADTHEFVLLTS